MSIKICPNCGNSISDSSRFCEHCGTSVLTEEEFLKIKAEKEEAKRLEEEQKEKDQKEREEMIKTARSLTESISSDISWWIPTTKKKVSTIIGLLLLGAGYYIQFAISSSDFNFISFLIIELLMLALYPFGSDFVWGIIFTFIRTVKVSNRLKNVDYGYNKGKPFELAYLYKAFNLLSSDTEFCKKNQCCIESIHRAFIFLEDTKGKQLIFVQFFVGFVLSLAELIFTVIFAVMFAVFVIVSIETHGVSNFFNSFSLEELKNILILFFVDTLVTIAFNIFKNVTNRKLLERAGKIEFKYTKS